MHLWYSFLPTAWFFYIVFSAFLHLAKSRAIFIALSESQAWMKNYESNRIARAHFRQFTINLQPLWQYLHIIHWPPIEVNQMTGQTWTVLTNANKTLNQHLGIGFPYFYWKNRLFLKTETFEINKLSWLNHCEIWSFSRGKARILRNISANIELYSFIHAKSIELLEIMW